MYRAISAPAADQPIVKSHRKVILATSLGTAFEWYDFYLYVTLAPILAKQFFSGLAPAAALVFALLAFAVGFVVRPFGALMFGRMGDLVGRKYTLLVTILVMGLSTFVVAIVPNYADIGVAAPVILIALRLMQGLALGGEYGCAVVYAAEHAPPGKRGAYTGWIQATASLGLLLSVLVVMGTQALLGESDFAEWGWRVPFVLSLVLLAVSVYVRMHLDESPVFTRMRATGGLSRAPLTEAFGRWSNLKVVLVALLGLTGGQAVVWYTGQFYAQYFLVETLKVQASTVSQLVVVALAVGAPCCLFFGMLSDRIGRKPIILTGCLLAALTYFPVFSALTHAANPDLAAAQATSAVVVVADPDECAFQFNPLAVARFTSSCDLVKQALSQAAVHYSNQNAPSGTIAQVRVGGVTVAAFNHQGLSRTELRRHSAEFERALGQALGNAGYPVKANMERFDTPVVLALLVYLSLLVAMVYGPLAALLVEMFPTRIRYTALSLPYHVGNGWFGGLLPAVAFAIVAQTGDMYNGLWYPIVVAGLTCGIGALFVKETKQLDTDLGA